MDVIMQALAKIKTEWMNNMFFAVQLARQK
jgi:hypothetical protein